MDFRLTEDQEALRDGVRAFCEGQVPAEKLAELEGAGFERALWGELAEMGVFGLRETEDRGGVGLGTAEAVLVFEELGRRLVPGPILWSHLAAGLVDGAAEGTTVVGGIDRLGALREPLLLEHRDVLDGVLVLHADGVDRVAPDAFDAQPVATPLDPHTPVHRIAAVPQGERIGDAETARRLRRDGVALASAQLLGIAGATCDLAVAYAKEREQFDRPIGSFQALKHILADMFVRTELARAAVYAAGATLDDPEVGSGDRAVAAARVVAGEAAMKNARACIQVHGGMGYTWEVPAHYYLKRTWVLETAFGTTDEHADATAEMVASAA